MNIGVVGNPRYADLQSILRLLADLAPKRGVTLFTGLVTLDGKSVTVTARGRLLVRTVAMQFDKYLRDASATAKYSKLI